MSTEAPSQEWCAERYIRHAGFVPALGMPVLDLLAPRPGERVLDLGCGDGTLTAEIVARGCQVVGVDAASDMVRKAQERGLDARVVDGHALPFVREFDAVFSNAALHWMKKDPDAVLRGVAAALRPGGRFVGEMGGHGNVAAIVVALLAVLGRRGVDVEGVSPWYFPDPDAWRTRLVAAGFEVLSIDLIPRPTILPGSMADWLANFAEPFVKLLPAADRADAVAEVEHLLRPALRDSAGIWTADYVRLRFSAHVAGS